MSRLTPKQERALSLLEEEAPFLQPENVPGETTTATLNRLCERGLVQHARLPGQRLRYRLTQTGVEAHKAIKDRTND